GPTRKSLRSSRPKSSERPELQTLAHRECRAEGRGATFKPSDSVDPSCHTDSGRRRYEMHRERFAELSCKLRRGLYSTLADADPPHPSRFLHCPSARGLFVRLRASASTPAHATAGCAGDPAAARHSARS